MSAVSPDRKHTVVSDKQARSHALAVNRHNFEEKRSRKKRLAQMCFHGAMGNATVDSHAVLGCRAGGHLRFVVGADKGIMKKKWTKPVMMVQPTKSV